MNDKPDRPLSCPDCGQSFPPGDQESLRRHMAGCAVDGFNQDAPAKLPDYESVRASFALEDSSELEGLVLEAVKAQNDVRWARLRLQGSDHKDSAWYRKMNLPYVPGCLEQIGSLLSRYGLRGFRFHHGTVSADIYEVHGVQSRLSKTKLLDLGVDASIIAQATVRTPYTAVAVKLRPERTDNALL